MAGVHPAEGAQPEEQREREASEEADDAPLRMLTKTDSVKIQLVNWTRAARPVETVLLVTIVILVWSSLSTLDWLHGTDTAMRNVDLGLKLMAVDANGTFTVWSQCTPSREDICSAALAGTTARILSYVSIILGCLLGASFVAEALDERELLVPIRAALPASLAPERLAVLPFLGWVILYCLIFVTLLVYSIAAPHSLGSGDVDFGMGFGRQRLALIFVLLAAAIHLTLIQRVRRPPPPIRCTSRASCCVSTVHLHSRRSVRIMSLSSST